MGELIDVYDSNKNPTGITVERETAFMHEGQYMLYVLAILENQQGQFLITRRALDKRWAAGWWEVPGGCASAGDSSFQAFTREVREEVGLAVPPQPAEPIFSYSNVDLERGDNYFVDIYHCKFPFDAADVTLQDSEAIDFQLASWADIEALAAEGVFLHFERLRSALGK